MNKFKVLLLNLFILIAINNFAQTNLDSLEKHLSSNKVCDTTYINQLNYLAYDLILNAEISKANYYLDNALQLSWSINYYKGIGNSFNHKGLCCYYKADSKNALIFYNFSCFVNYFISDYRGLSSTYSNMSLVYQDIGDFTNAIYYNLKALLIRESLKDDKSIAISYNNIGTTYHYMGQLQKALIYYKKAMQINERIKNETSLIYSISNIALIYFDLGIRLPEKLNNSMYDSAIVFNLKALELEKKYNDIWGLSITYNNLASIYSEKNEVKESISYYELARKTQEQLGDYKGLSLTLYNLANFNFSQNQFLKSITLCEKSLKIAIETQDVKLQTICYKLLSEAYAGVNNYEAAFKNIMKHNALAEKYYNADLDNKVLHLQKIYDENINEFKKLSIEVNSNNQSLQKNKTFWLILFIFIIVVFILSLSLYVNYKKKKRALLLLTAKNNQIINQNKEIHEKNELLNKTYIQLEHKNNSILSSLKYAQKIQETIFPIEKKIKELGFDFFVIYKPKDFVSGDFVWMTKIETEKYFISIIDCAGKAVPATFLSLIGNTLLNQIIHEKKIYNPSIILEKMQEEMYEIFKHQEKDIDLGDGMDISILKVENDIKLLTFAGANSRLCYIEKNMLNVINGEKTTISGLVHNVFKNNKISYNEPITVFLSTDGYKNQKNANGDIIGIGDFDSILTNLSEFKIEKHKNILINHLTKHQDEEEQTDDITIIGIELK